MPPGRVQPELEVFSLGCSHPMGTSKNLSDPSPVTSDPLGQNLGIIFLQAPPGDPRAAALGMGWDEATGRVHEARLPWGRWTAEAGKR